MRQRYDMVKFAVYGELPEDMFFNPRTLQNIADNDPIVQTITLCFDNGSTWFKPRFEETDVYTEYTLKPCCRKATYLCRNRKGKLYLLVAQN